MTTRLVALLLLSGLALGGAEAEYRARAAALRPDDADARFRLALWCDVNGLAAPAKAEYRRVLAADPDHPAARRALGFERAGPGWVKAGASVRALAVQARAARLEDRLAAIAALAARDGRPATEALLHRALLDREVRARAAAVDALRGGRGPRAYAAFVSTLGSPSPSLRLRAIEALGRLGDVRAIPVLEARLRVSGGSPQGAYIATVREVAAIYDYDVEVA